MKRYVFIGSVKYSAYCLKALFKMGINLVDIMCPYEEIAKFNSDYFDIGRIAEGFGQDVYYFKKIRDEAEHIKLKKPDIIFVLGLSQIIPKHILDIPTMGTIGSHPALLPRNRGRHPIIWAIANGLKKSGITLFWLNSGVDSGDVWGQKEFDIDLLDDASSIYEKMNKLSVEILKEEIPNLEAGIVKRVKQDDSKANCWRKRSYKDGEIDWRMGSKRIYDLVRALTKPYVGAHCIHKDKQIKIWETRIMHKVGRYENLEPGKVISANGLHLKVKTGDGIVEVLEHNFDSLPGVGEYI